MVLRDGKIQSHSQLKYYGESNNGKDVGIGQEVTLEIYEPNQPISI